VNTTILRWCTPMAFALLLSAPAAAQPGYANQSGSVTSSDIQRLQEDLYAASGDIATLRSRDRSQADTLQSQLDDLRDDVTYLKVKLRREGAVSRSEYDDVRSRIQDVRSQSRGEAPAARPGNSTWGTNSGARPPSEQSGSGGYYGGTQNAPQPARQARPGEVPSGQELDVRLESELSSATAQVEDRFRATTVVDLYQGNDVLIPAGSTLRGVVSSVDRATRTDRKGSMTLAFDQITIRGRNYQMRGTVSQALESEGIKGEAGKIGAGAGVGAILGGILGGAKGALLGILIGGGGTIAATPGKDVTLPAGTILRVRFDQPIQVR
jgi:TolA-binding protein